MPIDKLPNQTAQAPQRGCVAGYWGNGGMNMNDERIMELIVDLYNQEED